jgi:hypothetical protein
MLVVRYARNIGFYMAYAVQNCKTVRLSAIMAQVGGLGGPRNGSREIGIHGRTVRKIQKDKARGGGNCVWHTKAMEKKRMNG